MLLLLLTSLLPLFGFDSLDLYILGKQISALVYYYYH